MTDQEQRTARRTIEASLSKLMVEGFWFCHSCNRVCERQEGEQGQPAHCAGCKSHQIEFARLE